MIYDDNDGQMIFGDLWGLKLPNICLTGEENHGKNLTQETCPDRGSNPGPLRDRRACYRLAHSGGQFRPILCIYWSFQPSPTTVKWMALIPLTLCIHNFNIQSNLFILIIKLIILLSNQRYDTIHN